MTLSGQLQGTVNRSDIVPDNTKAFDLPLTDFRQNTAFNAVLAATGSGGDLGLYTGTFGTGFPYLSTGDVKTVTVTRYARCLFLLPPEYVDFGGVTVRCTAASVTTIADGAQTLTVEAYLKGSDNLISGGQLVSTGATSIKNTVFANYDYAVAANTLTRGGLLDIRVKINSIDAATSSAVIPTIAQVQILLTIQG